jgi:hypothetical protein
MTRVVKGSKLPLLLAATAALAVLGAPSASWAQYGSGGYGPSSYGAIQKCNLSGVNPAQHPEVFSNPTIAATYGFIQQGGAWHVAPGCRRGAAAAAPAAAAFAAQGKPVVGIGEPVHGGNGPGGLIMSDGLCWVQNGGTLYRWGACPQ